MIRLCDSICPKGHVAASAPLLYYWTLGQLFTVGLHWSGFVKFVLFAGPNWDYVRSISVQSPSGSRICSARRPLSAEVGFGYEFKSHPRFVYLPTVTCYARVFFEVYWLGKSTSQQIITFVMTWHSRGRYIPQGTQRFRKRIDACCCSVVFISKTCFPFTVEKKWNGVTSVREAKALIGEDVKWKQIIWS